MGDVAGEETNKALRITATNGDGASTRSSMPPVEEEQRRRRPAPPPAAGVDATAAEQRCREEEEADNEQVERFYTLLANIRALRGLYSAGDGGGSGTAAAGDSRGRKRAREEVPWRPAFRMEDFQEEVSHVAKAKQGTSGAGVARPSSATAMAGAADGAVREGDQVAEARGRKLGRRVAGRG